MKLRFPMFQLQRWTSLTRSSQVILVIYLYLYLEGLVSGKVLATIVNRVLNDAYGGGEVLLEAEGVCRLPPHYLLGLAAHLHNRLTIGIWPSNAPAKSNSKTKPESEFESNIGKLMENVDLEHVLSRIHAVADRMPKGLKNFYTAAAPGTIDVSGMTGSMAHP